MEVSRNELQWNLSIMDTIGTTKTVLYMEVSFIQWLNNTVKYYRGTRTSVLNREMSFIQGVLCREVPLYCTTVLPYTPDQKNMSMQIRIIISVVNVLHRLICSPVTIPIKFTPCDCTMPLVLSLGLLH